MKHLIVNADDFGYTRGVNRGIVEGFQRGIVTSTSLMANGAAFDDAVALVKAHPDLDVGCHINLVEGTPVSPRSHAARLLGTDERFHNLSGLVARLASGYIRAADLDRECSAQIERLLQAGIQPSHLDSHKHTHLHPQVAAAVARAAKRYSIGWVRRPFESLVTRSVPFFRTIVGRSLNLFSAPFARRMAAEGIRMPDSFTGFGLTGFWTRRAMEETIAALPAGTTELMCHPGYCDAELDSCPTRLKRQRATELEILTIPSWKEMLERLGVTLRGFRDIAAGASLAAPQGEWEIALPTGGEWSGK